MRINLNRSATWRMRSFPRDYSMLRIVPFAIIGTLVATVSAANPIADAPKEHIGFKTLKTEVVDLGPEIGGMAGRQLRLCVLSVAPGGHIGVRSHQARPSVVYAVQGIDTITKATDRRRFSNPETQLRRPRTRHTGTKTRGTKRSACQPLMSSTRKRRRSNR